MGLSGLSPKRPVRRTQVVDESSIRIHDRSLNAQNVFECCVAPKGTRLAQPADVAAPPCESDDNDATVVVLVMGFAYLMRQCDPHGGVTPGSAV